MNRLEKMVHEALEGKPAIRNSLKFFYQIALSQLPTKNFNEESILVRPNSFYGFHTTSPWSADNKFLLSHKFNRSKMARPKMGECISIGVYSGKDFTEYKEIGKSKAWNWQQGTMLQWLGGDNSIIYNDVVDGVHKAVVINSDAKKKFYDYPIAAVSPRGNEFASYSFDRLGKGLDGYGYSAGDSAVGRIFDSSSLVIVNCETGGTSILFTLKEIRDFEKKPSFERAHHFFSHCLYSPDGSALMFFHRWRSPGGDVKSRAMIYSFERKSLVILPLGEYVSHASWVSKDEVVLYAEDLRGVRGYFLINYKGGGAKNIGTDCFNSDGHPQVMHKAGMMLTDTYPNRRRMQSLYLFDLLSKKSQLLLSLKIPLKYRNAVRCDFHPRWDRSGEYVSFDSAHTGIRSHCTVKVSDLLN